MYNFYSDFISHHDFGPFFPRKLGQDFHFHVLNFVGICLVATSINCYSFLQIKTATTIR
jgi:hypothetical protein